MPDNVNYYIRSIIWITTPLGLDRNKQLLPYSHYETKHEIAACIMADLLWVLFYSICAAMQQ